MSSTANEPAITVGILTVSDRGSRGEYEDRSGPLIKELILDNTPWPVTHQAVIPDDIPTIAETLSHWCAAEVNLILTTGGTGFAPRDVTPEATRQVITREAPGIAEALRAESLRITPHAMLSRGVAGLCGASLIINLPGSPKAVRENMAVLWPILPHALELLVDAPDSEAGHGNIN